jgi:hypothetical protein
MVRAGALLTLALVALGCHRQQRAPGTVAVRPDVDAVRTAADSAARVREVWAFFEQFPTRSHALVAMRGRPASLKVQGFVYNEPTAPDTLINVFYRDLRFTFFRSAADSANEFLIVLEAIHPSANVPFINVGLPCVEARRSIGTPYADTTANGERKLSFVAPGDGDANTFNVVCRRERIIRVTWLPYWD